jgi:hypothetical protein
MYVNKDERYLKKEGGSCRRRERRRQGFKGLTLEAEGRCGAFGLPTASCSKLWPVMACCSHPRQLWQELMMDGVANLQ